MPRTLLTACSARVALLSAAALLTGCTLSSEDGTIGEQLGFAVGSPDAFMIIAREPIQMPPDNSLPTPQPGAASPRMPDPYAEARESLFGSPEEPERLASTSTGEEALLAGAGATTDNSAVRAEIDAEVDTERKFGLTSFFGMPIPANLDNPNIVVDSQGENERLRQQGLLTPTAPPVEEEDDE
ncbi:DUF3035 domain-containing protein [Pikeienuella piscinae]|uniref:DUF3035 domain-containing protein n=1 Tax=Pikeienuella piscinae TaxID=2748098 RepID=A0A7L5C0K9_9RHOB|nr:DUF3035 domain-containing protein [Pikeienuella piscinae]QIE56923.1 DUF3035 domain-containing protein [Pikeienuella piscinae]